MNESSLVQLKVLVERAVRPVQASDGRKKCMREELLEHLWESYQEDLLRLRDERTALNAAQQRFGDAQDLRQQLQASVPIVERILFTCLPPMENVMIRWLLWIVGVVAAMLGMLAVFPKYGVFINFTAIVVFSGFMLLDLCRSDGYVSRVLSPRLVGLLGFTSVIFGTAIVLPALAKLKQSMLQSLTGEDVRSLIYAAVTIGVLLAIEGLCFIAYGLLARRTRIV